MGSEVSTGSGRAARGRDERRQAILDGAFAVFARHGYARTCVMDIAREAGVAKPTVYNHLHDKESLYREAVEGMADRVGAQGVAAVDPLREAATAGDPRASLTTAGHALLAVLTSQDARAVRQLAGTQATQFPGLAASVHARTAPRVRAALADRLARLSLAGHLRPCDPDLAAAHFLALLTGPLEYQPEPADGAAGAGDAAGDSDGGTVGGGAVDATGNVVGGAAVDAAVDVFLRAYGG
ncbi:TetR/AcrR family transcriptional regulator [Streptomyces sp. NPDC057702]|uniref:TetR/AcrR family transcriptional regulator n=1 Tax=unclassified Streptomyces TaxID=2593676 RepID=UPI0036C4BE13